MAALTRYIYLCIYIYIYIYIYTYSTFDTIMKLCGYQAAYSYTKLYVICIIWVLYVHVYLYIYYIHMCLYRHLDEVTYRYINWHVSVFIA